MKVKLQSDSKLQLVKAVKEVLNLSLTEAKHLVDEQIEKDDKFYVIIDSEKTEERIKEMIGGCGVTCTPLSDIDFCKPTCNQTETVKITSIETGPLLNAVMKLLPQLTLEEASDFIREHTVHIPTCKWIWIKVNKPRKEIEAIVRNIPGIEIQFLNNVDTATPESTNCGEAEQKLQKTKPQEVTDEDLGVSIHSIDEMSIGWQCKMLFSHEQATRVLAGLHDAKFNVTETHVTYKGDKATMLVITKTFPNGTRKKDLEKFEEPIRNFIHAVCTTVSLEDALEDAKEAAIKAFEDIRNYE